MAEKTERKTRNEQIADMLENGELLLPDNSGQGYIQILAMEPE